MPEGVAAPAVADAGGGEVERKREAAAVKLQSVRRGATARWGLTLMDIAARIIQHGYAKAKRDFAAKPWEAGERCRVFPAASGDEGGAAGCGRQPARPALILEIHDADGPGEEGGGGSSGGGDGGGGGGRRKLFIVGYLDDGTEETVEDEARLTDKVLVHDDADDRDTAGQDAWTAAEQAAGAEVDAAVTLQRAYRAYAFRRKAAAGHSAGGVGGAAGGGNPEGAKDGVTLGRSNGDGGSDDADDQDRSDADDGEDDDDDDDDGDHLDFERQLRGIVGDVASDGSNGGAGGGDEDDDGGCSANSPDEKYGSDDFDGGDDDGVAAATAAAAASAAAAETKAKADAEAEEAEAEAAAAAAEARAAELATLRQTAAAHAALLRAHEELQGDCAVLRGVQADLAALRVEHDRLRASQAALLNEQRCWGEAQGMQYEDVAAALRRWWEREADHRRQLADVRDDAAAREAALTAAMEAQGQQLRGVVARQQAHIEVLEERCEQYLFEEKIRDRLSAVQRLRGRTAAAGTTTTPTKTTTTADNSTTDNGAAPTGASGAAVPSPTDAGGAAATAANFNAHSPRDVAARSLQDRGKAKKQMRATSGGSGGSGSGGSGRGSERGSGSRSVSPMVPKGAATVGNTRRRSSGGSRHRERPRSMASAGTGGGGGSDSFGAGPRRASAPGGRGTHRRSRSGGGGGGGSRTGSVGGGGRGRGDASAEPTAEDYRDVFFHQYLKDSNMTPLEFFERQQRDELRRQQDELRRQQEQQQSTQQSSHPAHGGSLDTEGRPRTESGGSGGSGGSNSGGRGGSNNAGADSDTHFAQQQLRDGPGRHSQGPAAARQQRGSDGATVEARGGAAALARERRRRLLPPSSKKNKKRGGSRGVLPSADGRSRGGSAGEGKLKARLRGGQLVFVSTT